MQLSTTAQPAFKTGNQPLSSLSSTTRTTTQPSSATHWTASNPNQLLANASHEDTSAILFNQTFDKTYRKLLKTNEIKKLLDLNYKSNSEIIVQRIRESFLIELDVNTRNLSLEDRFKLLDSALKILINLEKTIKDNQQFVTTTNYISHQKAKLFYELATILLQDTSNSVYSAHFKPIDDDTQEVINQTAKMFILGFLCYKPELSLDTYGELIHFDCYYPEQRQASLLCNLIVCEQAGADIESISKELSLNGDALDKFQQLEESLKHIIDGIESKLGHKRDIDIDHLEQIKNALNDHSEESTLTTKDNKRKNNPKDIPKKKKRTNLTSAVVSNIDLYAAYKDKLNAQSSNQLEWLNQICTIEHIAGFLRDYQQQDISTSLESITNYCAHLPPETQVPAPRLMITKPTGTGKSALIIEFARRAIMSNVPVIIIVPSIILVEQFFAGIQSFSERHHLGLDDVARYLPTKNQYQLGPLTIITQASFVNMTKKSNRVEMAKTSKLHNFFKFENLQKCLILMDEAHHADGEQMQQLLKGDLKAPIIGFSASTLNMETEYPQLCDIFTLRPVNQSLVEAVHDGHLSKIQCTEIDFSMFKEARALQQQIRYKSDSEINKEVQKLYTKKLGFTLTACSLFIQMMALPKSQKGLVFTCSIEHAEQLALILSYLMKQTIFAYHSKTPNRDDVLRSFIETKANGIIVAVGALDEGFDCTSVNRILDLEVYKERTRRLIQRLGRGARLRDTPSDLLVVSTKILSYSDQKLPGQLFGSQIGNGEFDDLDVKSPCLPHPITDTKLIQSILSCVNLNDAEDVFDQQDITFIEPSAAKIKYPSSRRRINIGEPPDDIIEEPVSSSNFVGSSFPQPVPEHDATSFTTTPPLTVDSNFLLNIPGEAMNLMSDEEMNMFMDGVF